MSLGLTLATQLTREYETESDLGNLAADLLVTASPNVDAAFINGGILRANLPKGELSYGAFYRAIPQDHRLVTITIDGRTLRHIVEDNLRRGGGIYSWSRLTATVTCTPTGMQTTISINGAELQANRTYRLATTDYLAEGGDQTMLALSLPASRIAYTDEFARDAMAKQLQLRAANVNVQRLMQPRRLTYPGTRPVRCMP